MKEYINREDLLAECNEVISNIQFSSPYQEEIAAVVSGMEQVKDLINDASAADVAPIVYGHWIDTDTFDFHCTHIYQCSNCGKEVADDYISCHKFCLHCGARMDGGNK